MLIIGHRGGAAGTERENTPEALRVGLASGADMLEFDVRLTKDDIPVLLHDFTTLRTHHDPSIIRRQTFAEIQKRTAEYPITPLADVLDEFFGKIILNIELKGIGTGKVVAAMVKNNYIKHHSDWDALLISSFRGGELEAVRRESSQARLALLHRENPYLFVAYHRKIHLTAVGFHRLYMNPLALEIAKKAQLFIYVYTVNRQQTARRMAEQHIDGIVTDDPAAILHQVA